MKPVRVLSFGAGVQSSAILCAYLNGVLKDPPEFAVFADTQVEPKSVYDWLDKMIAYSDGRIPIVIASRGNMINDYLTAPRFAVIPFYMTSLDGTPVMARRQCTREYKIDVIKQAIRKRLGYAKGERVKHKVQQIIGISTDEIIRMKPSRDVWIENVWPLIDELNWARGDCISYVKSLGIGTPPKSSCYVCPYRSAESWKNLKRDEPEAFAAAVAFEREVQRNSERTGFHGAPFLHSSRKPLDQINWDALAPDQRELFGEECEGMCGV